MKLDRDIKRMGNGARGRELQRLRKLIRTHKCKKNNARCWMNDRQLYQSTLPEGSRAAGRMTLPFKVLIKNCERYIRRQKCDVRCPLKKVCDKNKKKASGRSKKPRGK